MKLCADCLYCKLFPGWKTAHCKNDLWDTLSNGREKIVRLNKSEIASLELRHRRVFEQAQRCPAFEEME